MATIWTTSLVMLPWFRLKAIFVYDPATVNNVSCPRKWSKWPKNKSFHYFHQGCSRIWVNLWVTELVLPHSRSWSQKRLGWMPAKWCRCCTWWSRCTWPRWSSPGSSWSWRRTRCRGRWEPCCRRGRGRARQWRCRRSERQSPCWGRSPKNRLNENSI